MEYIDKSALVAEIERLRERFIAFHHRDGHDWPLDNYGKMRAYNEVLSFLDTLEVKEVDLEKEYEEFVVDDPILNVFIQNDVMGMKVAKHFFELGMAVSNKTQNIWHDASEKLPTGVIVVNNCGSLHRGWSTDEGDGIEDEHGRLITKTYQKWAREEDLT